MVVSAGAKVAPASCWPAMATAERRSATWFISATGLTDGCEGFDRIAQQGCCADIVLMVQSPGWQHAISSASARAGTAQNTTELNAQTTSRAATMLPRMPRLQCCWKPILTTLH